MNKIIIKRKVTERQALNEQGVVKLDAEAVGIINVILQQTNHTAKFVVSEIIKQAVNNGLLEFEGATDGREEDISGN